MAYCLQNYDIISELLICSALLWQNALTEYPLATSRATIYILLSPSVHVNGVHWNVMLTDVCGFPHELIYYSNPLIASLLELLQTNACAKTDWGEAGHTSVRCWSKSHPLPVWHSYLVNKENWFSMSPNKLSRIREVVKVKCNAHFPLQCVKSSCFFCVCIYYYSYVVFYIGFT